MRELFANNVFETHYPNSVKFCQYRHGPCIPQISHILHFKAPNNPSFLIYLCTIVLIPSVILGINESLTLLMRSFLVLPSDKIIPKCNFLFCGIDFPTVIFYIKTLSLLPISQTPSVGQFCLSTHAFKNFFLLSLSLFCPRELR